MLRAAIGIIAIASLASAPCMAAGVDSSGGHLSYRAGAVAGAYLSIPLSGRRSDTPKAGLRLQATRDYRGSAGIDARTVGANALDLRLIGAPQATLYVANMPVTGKEARKHRLMGGTGIISTAILVAAAVGAYVIYKAVDDKDTDGEICLLPEGCK